jgi:hypothetical protein
MQFDYIESSIIKAIAYDEDSEELYILFNSGRLYGYIDVSHKEYKGFFKVKSKGKYFHKYIRHQKVYYEV